MNVQVQEANKADPTAAKATATPSLDSASAPTALFSHKPKTAAK